MRLTIIKKIGDYILLDQIGQGTFSKVTRAFHTISEQIVAVKILNKENYTGFEHALEEENARAADVSAGGL